MSDVTESKVESRQAVAVVDDIDPKSINAHLAPEIQRAISVAIYDAYQAGKRAGAIEERQAQRDRDRPKRVEQRYKRDGRIAQIRDRLFALPYVDFVPSEEGSFDDLVNNMARFYGKPLVDLGKPRVAGSEAEKAG